MCMQKNENRKQLYELMNYVQCHVPEPREMKAIKAEKITRHSVLCLSNIKAIS